MPRSATKVTLSHEAYVRKLHLKAVDLEEQVAEASKKQSNSSNDEASRLRLPLCETMTNLILLDPAFSAQKDIAGRLWRCCFYTRIGPQRARVEKQRRRGLDVSRQEESLGTFLSESVVLYDYLITNLKTKLMKKFGMPLEEESTQEYSQVSASVAPPAGVITEGIVSLLTTCHISLGDLCRYSNNLDKAEKAYRTAAALAPGLGHAYNQLAVVCQMKEKQGSPLSAVAFYWYARALLVTRDPFNVARSNLARLLASNHDWIVEQEAESNDTSKSIMTRRFLGMFVDLQFRFFQGIEESAIANLMEQKETVVSRFKALLEMSAFGDALLCRLVVIHAFSECFLDRLNGNPTKLTMVMARVATYEFGSCLVDRVLVALTKAADGQLPSSVRLLLPVLLVAEYTSTVSMPQSDSVVATDALGKATKTFWQGMIAIWNKISQLAPSDLLQTTPTEELKGFSELRGFGPFGFLPPCEDGLLSEGECLQELMQVNEKANETASTSTGSAVGGGATDQGRLKFARLLRLADMLMTDPDGTVSQYINKDVDGDFVWFDNSPEGPNGVEDPMDVDRGDENMLVYKTGAGGGPALLVPGMLLQDDNTQDVSLTTTPKKPSMTPDNQDQSVASSDPLPVFDATPASLQNTDTPLAIPHPTEPTVGNPAGTPPFGLAPAGLNLPPGLNSSVGGMLPPPPGFASPAPPPPQPPSTRQAETIGEAMRLYGDQLQTSNPFVDPPPGLFNDFAFSVSAAPSGSGFLGGSSNNNDDPMAVEGASLLDSGLLNSLWMDDSKSKSKNPFAT